MHAVSAPVAAKVNGRPVHPLHLPNQRGPPVLEVGLVEAEDVQPPKVEVVVDEVRARAVEIGVDAPHVIDGFGQMGLKSEFVKNV